MNEDKYNRCWDNLKLRLNEIIDSEDLSDVSKSMVMRILDIMGNLEYKSYNDLDKLLEYIEIRIFNMSKYCPSMEAVNTKNILNELRDKIYKLKNKD